MNETPEKRKRRQEKDLESTRQALMNETPEKRKKRQQKVLECTTKALRKGTKLTRLNKFRERTRWGPCFPCISCHQILFKNQVIVYEQSVQDKLKEEFREALSTRNRIFFIAIEPNEDKEKILKTEGTNCYICNACYHCMKQGKYPRGQLTSICSQFQTFLIWVRKGGGGGPVLFNNFSNQKYSEIIIIIIYFQFSN